MKKSILLLILILSITSSYGQDGAVKGKVVTSQNKAISNVNITISKTNKGTITSTQGEYEIKGIKTGNYTLKASSIGYDSQEISITISNKKVTQVPKITLQENQEQLNEVIITGHKNAYLSREPSTSLRLKSELIKTPQNIQIISSEVIKDQQAINMMEGITRNVSGAQMIEHWGTFARINMRGFNLPAFRNGMNVSMPWGPLSEDMSMVERIEFVKGPAGFMMAAGEPGGFYNVVTKKPSKNKIAEVSFTLGSFNTYRGTLDLGSYTSNGKLQYRINAMAESQESHRDFEKSSRFSIVPSVKYEISDKTSLTTEFTYQRADAPIGRAYVFAPIVNGYKSLPKDFSLVDDSFPNSDIEEVNFFTNFTHNFNDNWSLESQYSYINYNQEGMSIWPQSVAENGDIIRGITGWDALNNAHLAQLFISGKFNTGSISHSILAGFDFNDKEYWADWSQGGAIDTTPFNIFNPVYGNAVFPTIDRSVNIRSRGIGGHQGAVTRGYYVQDEIGLIDNRLRITLAGRYTSTSVFAYGDTTDDEKFTPRVGLSFDILPDFTIYGLYDQSFSPQFGLNIEEKPFDPEEATDIEAGLKKTWFDGKLSTSLTAYQITKQNILVAHPIINNTSIQLGEVQSKGIEFDMQGQITPELNVILNYANTNVEITEDTNPENIGDKIAGHAKHITNGWLNYSFKEKSTLKGFGLSLGYQYQADRSSWGWGGNNESQVADYFRLDGGVSWKNEKFNIRLNINNLLNEYLYSGSAYAYLNSVYWQSEPGTNGRLTVTYKF